MIVQNAAKSGVGSLVITFVWQRGLHMVNLVRRENLFPELEALGADVCLGDRSNLSERPWATR